ncbi:MAG: ShlB/FhaC/HecB family hemolysin secretion/activation protein [Gammaproteobacteria bacterium]
MRRLFKLRIYAAIFSFFLLAFTTANAIDFGGQLPNAFDAGQAQKYLKSTTLPTLAPQVTAHVETKTPPSAPIPQAEKIKLKLTRVIITGNTVYKTEDLEKIFAPSLNKTISLADLQALVEEISKKYREAGYVLSRAILPAQEIKHGVVKVQVIEGYVSNVAVQGDPGRDKALLEQYGKNVMKSKPLKLQDLERVMLLINDLSGLTVKSVLTPSKTIPASSDLTLVATRQWVNAYFIYDDYGSRFLGPREVSYGGNVNSLIAPGDKNAFHFSQTSVKKQLYFEEFVHSQPIGTSGLIWTLGSNYTRTQPGFTLRNADIIGQSFSAYSNFDYSLFRARSQNLTLRAMLNYQNVNSTILGLPFYQDRFRSLGLGAYFDIADSWLGANSMELDFYHGFPIFGAQNHFLQSRPRGQTAFSKFNFTGSRLQGIKGRFSAYLSTQAQYAFNSQLATQQYSYGGAVYGRGYDPSEIVGDRGLAAKFELRMDTSPELRFLQTMQFYLFYDAGIVWNISNVGQPPKLSANSTGGGARITLIPQVSGEFFIAKPLTRQVATLVAIDQNGTQARVFFQLTAKI